MVASKIGEGLAEEEILGVEEIVNRQAQRHIDEDNMADVLSERSENEEDLDQGYFEESEGWSSNNTNEGKPGSPDLEVEAIPEEPDDYDTESTFEPFDEAFFPPERTTPDGGYGWVVVAACFFCNVFVDGIAYSFGVLFKVLTDHFQESEAKTAWVGSLLSGMYLTVGPIVSALVNVYGVRPVCIAGAVISAAAFLLSTLSMNLEFLMVTYGILGGIGFGLIYLPSVVAIVEYFTHRRALATGIAVCGSGVGTFVIAPITNILVNHFGWRGTIMVQAGFILHVVLCGMLMRPLKSKEEDEDAEADKNDGLLQKIAEDKQRSLERSHLGDSAYCTVQKNDGSFVQRLKQGLNLEPGVHSNLALQNVGIGTPDLVATPRPTKLAMIREGAVTPLAQTEGNASEVGTPPTPTPRPHVQKELPDIQRVMQAEGIGMARQGSQTSVSTSQRRNSCESTSPVSLKPPQVKRYSLSGSSRQKMPFLQSERSLLSRRSRRSSIRSNSRRSSMRSSRGSRLHLTSQGPVTRLDAFYTGSRHHLVAQSRQSLKGLGLTAGSQSAMGMSRGSIFYMGSQATRLGGDQDEVDLIGEEPKTGFKAICSPNFTGIIRQMLDFSLLKQSPVLVLIIIQNIFGMLGFFVPFVYTVKAATDKVLAEHRTKGIAEDVAAYILSVIGVTNTLGRLFSGWLCDHSFIDSLLVNNLSLLICGGILLLEPLCSSYASFVALGIGYGFFISGYVTVTAVMLVQLLGLENLTSSFGLLLFFRGLATFISSPVAGAIFDYTQNFDASFLLAGCCLITSALFGFLIPFIKRFDNIATPKAPVHSHVQQLEEIPEDTEPSSPSTSASRSPMRSVSPPDDRSIISSIKMEDDRITITKEDNCVPQVTIIDPVQKTSSKTPLLVNEENENECTENEASPEGLSDENKGLNNGITIPKITMDLVETGSSVGDTPKKEITMKNEDLSHDENAAKSDKTPNNLVHDPAPG